MNLKPDTGDEIRKKGKHMNKNSDHKPCSIGMRFWPIAALGLLMFSAVPVRGEGHDPLTTTAQIGKYREQLKTMPDRQVIEELIQATQHLPHMDGVRLATSAAALRERQQATKDGQLSRELLSLANNTNLPVATRENLVGTIDQPDLVIGEGLIRIILDSNEPPSVREAASMAFATAEETTFQQLAPQLASLIRTENNTVVILAVMRAFNIHSIRVVESSLLSRVNDRDEMIQTVAIMMLGHPYRPPSDVEPLHQATVRVLIEKATSANEIVAGKAVAALEQTNSQAAVGLLKRLAQRKETPEHVKWQIANNAHKLTGGAAILTDLLNDADDTIAEKCAESLAKMRARDAIPSIKKRLEQIDKRNTWGRQKMMEAIRELEK